MHPLQMWLDGQLFIHLLAAISLCLFALVIFKIRMEESYQLLGYISELIGSQGVNFIHKKGVDSLLSGECLSTEIIDFWLNYLMAHLVHSYDKDKILVYSSVIFTRIREDIKEVIEGTKSFSASWGVKANELFLKDYIFLPIHQGNHYLLAVICFPGLIGKNADVWKTAQLKLHGKRLTIAEVDTSKIIVLNSSYKMGNRDLISTTLWKFLSVYWEKEYKIRVHVGQDNCPVLFPKVPQQGMTNDCGLFVLQYFEEFFVKPFNTKKMPLENLADWFDKEKVFTKRGIIYNNIKEYINLTHPERVKHLPLFL